MALCEYSIGNLLLNGCGSDFVFADVCVQKRGSDEMGNLRVVVGRKAESDFMATDGHLLLGFRVLCSRKSRHVRSSVLF